LGGLLFVAAHLTLRDADASLLIFAALFAGQGGGAAAGGGE